MTETLNYIHEDGEVREVPFSYEGRDVVIRYSALYELEDAISDIVLEHWAASPSSGRYLDIEEDITDWAYQYAMDRSEAIDDMAKPAAI